MREKRFLAAVLSAAVAFPTLGGAAFAQQRKTSCAKIMEICMRRAGDGHAAICEDMYSQARNTGQWPATQEPDGTKHAPVPCTP